MIFCFGPEHKLENNDSVQHGLSGIRKGAKIYFYGHFNSLTNGLQQFGCINGVL